MADLNKTFGLLRIIAMSVSILLAVLVLIMGALVTTFTMSNFAGYFIYAAFGIAVASLTIMTVPVMLFISINRKGAFTSMVVVELVWIGLLWVLWLAVGGTIASVPWLNYCSSLSYYYGGTQEACMETQAMAAFAFLNWLLLMVLNITLFSLAITQSSRGNGSIWTSYVTEADFTAPAPNAQVPMEPKIYATPGIPQQQPQFVPQQVQPFAPQQQYAGSPPPQFTGSTQYVPQAAQV